MVVPSTDVRSMREQTGRVFVHEPDGSKYGQLDVFTQVDAIDRDMAAGSWSITGPTTDTMRALATPGWRVRIMFDDEEFLAGPNNVDEDTADIDNPSGTTTVSGFSDSARLWEYLCYPSLPLFTTVGWDEQWDVAETVMKHFVRYNLLDDSRKPAGVAQFMVAPDLGRGFSLPVRARFDNLGDKLVSIATTGGNLGFDIKNRIFDIYDRADRSREVVFSFGTGNLIQYKRKRTRPTANRIVCGGSGEGTARVFKIGQDDDSAETWGAYIESFRDRRDTSDDSDGGEMDQSIQEELVKGAEKNELTLRTIDLPGRTYRKNYNKGDIVTAQGIVGRVGQVQLTLNDKGLVILPSVNSSNTANAEAILRVYDMLLAQRRRLAHLERSL